MFSVDSVGQRASFPDIFSVSLLLASHEWYGEISMSQLIRYNTMIEIHKSILLSGKQAALLPFYQHNLNHNFCAR